MHLNNSKGQQFTTKKRCYNIGSSKQEGTSEYNHNNLEKQSLIKETQSCFCEKYTLKVIMLIILSVITIILFQVSLATEGYEVVIGEIIQQRHQNSALADQISSEFIQVKTSIQNEAIATSDNIEQLISVASKVQSKISILQPKLKSLEHKTNVLELVVAGKNQKIKNQEIINIMSMRENIFLSNGKAANGQIKQHKSSLDFEETVGQDYLFSIPKNIWIYKEDSKNYLQYLYLKNNAYYGNISEYRIHYVNSDSIQNYFDSSVERKLKSILEIIGQKAPGGKTSSIYKKVLLLHFLYNYGGIVIDGPYAFTEDLNWIKEIVKNKFCSRGNRMVKPQMIGFFNPRDAQQKKYFQIIPFDGMQQINKYTYQFPAFQDYFIASAKKARYLSQVLHKIYEMLDNNRVNQMKDSFQIKSFKTQESYSLIFFIAAKIVLKEKQKEIDLLSKDGYKHFAFDYYGLNFINCYYGPLKMFMIYEDSYFLIRVNPQGPRHRIYHDMARYTLEQWTTLVGNTKYLFSLTLEESMNKYLQATSSGKDIQIYQGSFIHKLFFPEDKHYFIVSNPERPFTNQTNPLWQSLPRYIWIFWYTGIKTAPIFTQACYQNLKRAAQNSGFELREVNNQNIHNYLDEDILARIDNSVNGAKIQPHLQTKSNFYRLALLYQHGGIYLDATTLALENFDWVLKIGRFPSQYIVNRFETLPKVLMMWHPYFGQPEEWHFYNIDKIKNVKQQWHQSLQNGLLIAEKGSQFIGDWLQGMFLVHSMPYMEVERLYTASGISKHKSTYQDFHYLIAMDTGKYVIGKKQKQLQKLKDSEWVNAPHYYNIWTFSGYLNPMKLWVKSNYDNPLGEINDLIFKYPLEHVDEIIGKTRFVSKFFGYQTTGINQFIVKNYGNFSALVHSRSIFMKYIWRDDFKIDGSQGIQLIVKND